MKRIKYILTTAFAAVATLSFASCPVKKAVKVKNTPVDSVALTIEKAQDGDAKAQNTLGIWYYTGKDSPEEMADVFLEKGAQNVIIKLGGRGCYICDGKYYSCLPTYDMPVVDTTAAGDAFTAGLTLEYMRSGNMVRAGKYANAVGSLAVGVKGALPSIPTEAAVDRFIEENGVL